MRQCCEFARDFRIYGSVRSSAGGEGSSSAKIDGRIYLILVVLTVHATTTKITIHKPIHISTFIIALSIIHISKYLLIIITHFKSGNYSHSLLQSRALYQYGDAYDILYTLSLETHMIYFILYLWRRIWYFILSSLDTYEILQFTLETHMTIIFMFSIET